MRREVRKMVSQQGRRQEDGFSLGVWDNGKTMARQGRGKGLVIWVFKNFQQREREGSGREPKLFSLFIFLKFQLD